MCSTAEWGLRNGRRLLDLDVWRSDGSRRRRGGRGWLELVVVVDTAESGQYQFPPVLPKPRCRSAGLGQLRQRMQDAIVFLLFVRHIVVKNVKMKRPVTDESVYVRDRASRGRSQLLCSGSEH